MPTPTNTIADGTLLIFLPDADVQLLQQTKPELEDLFQTTTQCALKPNDEESPRDILQRYNFDQKMRAAENVIIVTPQLRRKDIRNLAGEIATRCRQAGVPAHVVTKHLELDDFDLRMLDLQRVVEAR